MIAINTQSEVKSKMKRSFCLLVLGVLLSVFICLHAQGLELSDSQQRVLERQLNGSLMPKVQRQVPVRDLRLVGYIQEVYETSWENDLALALLWDANERVSAVVSKYWDWDLNQWTNDLKYQISYRPNSSPNSVEILSWNGTMWAQEGNILYDYTGNKINTITTQMLVDAQLVDMMTQEYSYVGSSNVIEHVTITINMFDLRDRFSMRTYFTWDGLGRPSFATLSVENDTGVWTPIERTHITYHQQDTSTYDDFYTHILMQPAMGDYDIMPFGSYFMINEEVTYVFEASLWSLQNKTSYLYNTGTLALEEVKDYYYASEQWVQEAQDDFSYDEDGYMLQWLYSQVIGSDLFFNERKTYQYENMSDSQDPTGAPMVSSLKVFPNPFNPKTNISFDLSKAEQVRVEIFNLKGQRVRTLLDEFKASGNHQVSWNGKDERGLAVGSGMYIVRLKSAHNSKSAKILLLK